MYVHPTAIRLTAKCCRGCARQHLEESRFYRRALTPTVLKESPFRRAGGRLLTRDSRLPFLPLEFSADVRLNKQVPRPID